MKLPADFDVLSSSQPTLQAFYNPEHALIRIQVPDLDQEERTPSTIVLVLDVSGSMGGAAASHDDSDGAPGLSQLDIVKHTSRTLVESLSERDQLALVAFHSTASTVFPLQFMTTENKQAATTAIDSLAPLGSTNLYDGLIQGLELVQAQQEKNLPASNPNVLVLTDGMPNASPPRGELASLQRYMENHPTLAATTRICDIRFWLPAQKQTFGRDCASRSIGLRLYSRCLLCRDRLCQRARQYRSNSAHGHYTTTRRASL